jgi:predicted transcriptional regulator
MNFARQLGLSPTSCRGIPEASSRTRSRAAPLDSGIVQVTRAEYEALLARVEALEAANTVNKAVNKPVNTVNTERSEYMREYMRKRRLAKQAS